MSAEARKHKIPSSYHLFIVQWNNRFVHLPGEKDSARCTWMNNTDLLSDKKCCTSTTCRAKFGMMPWEFTKYELEVLLGFYRRGLMPLLLAFCVVFLYQMLSWPVRIPAFTRTRTAITLASLGVKSVILQLANLWSWFLFQGRHPTQSPWTTKAMV